MKGEKSKDQFKIDFIFQVRSKGKEGKLLGGGGGEEKKEIIPISDNTPASFDFQFFSFTSSGSMYNTNRL